MQSHQLRDELPLHLAVHLASIKLGTPQEDTLQVPLSDSAGVRSTARRPPFPVPSQFPITNESPVFTVGPSNSNSITMPTMSWETKKQRRKEEKAMANATLHRKGVNLPGGRSRLGPWRQSKANRTPPRPPLPQILLPPGSPR